MAISNEQNREAQKKRQADWVKGQRTCRTTECLLGSYRDRLKELAKVNGTEFVEPPEVAERLNPPVKFPLSFKLIEGEGYPICKEYTEMLNAAKYSDYPACGRKILPSFPQFNEVMWERISDKKIMKEIVNKNLEISHASFALPGVNPENDDNLQRTIKLFNQFIDADKLEIYLMVADIAKKGKSQTLYKIVFPREEYEKNYLCQNTAQLYIQDNDVNLSNPKQYNIRGYKRITLLSGQYDYDVFKRAGVVYFGQWSGRLEAYSLDVFSLESSVDCKISGDCND
jgi:hypothetical protein